MADANRYGLRICDAPPTELALEPAAPGVLYEGPYGLAYMDAAEERVRIRGAFSVDYEQSLFDMSDAVKEAGLSLTVDGRRLLMRRRGRGWSRAGRAIAVYEGDLELVSFRLRRISSVSMERPDATRISTLPTVPPGAGTLVADTQQLEVALLVAFCTSTMSTDLDLKWYHL